MIDKEKYIILAKKLKALAEQWEGGEAVNAQAQLDAIIKKYDLDIDDVVQDRRKERTVIVPKSGRIRKLAIQIVYNVCGSISVWNSYDRSRIFFEATDAEFISFEHKFWTYRGALKKHLEQEEEIAYRAFIYANNLYMKKDPNEKWEGGSPKLTAEELDIVMKAMFRKPNATPIFNSLQSWTP